jgi:hypothetical protein
MMVDRTSICKWHPTFVQHGAQGNGWKSEPEGTAAQIEIRFVTKSTKSVAENVDVTEDAIVL